MRRVFVDEQIKNMDFNVQPGESLVLNMVSFARFPNATIHVKVQENASFEGVFADFSKDGGTLKVSVELLGRDARANWRSACICAGDSNKTIDAGVIHAAPNTSGLVANYGIVQDRGRLSFLGVSQINNGAVESSTRQEAQIIVFDDGCQGKAMPVLKIDENEVTASHAAVVGRLNEAHLFYLLSRGIPLEAARRLLTLGYLKPIEERFEDEELKNRIDAAIEEGI